MDLYSTGELDMSGFVYKGNKINQFCVGCRIAGRKEKYRILSVIKADGFKTLTVRVHMFNQCFYACMYVNATLRGMERKRIEPFLLKSSLTVAEPATVKELKATD